MNSKQRRQRRRRYVRCVKERIERDQHFGPLFTSHQYLIDDGFADFLFVGIHQDREVVWNSCMSTLRADYYEHVNDIALMEGYELFPDPEGYKPFSSVPYSHDSNGKVEYWEMVENEEFKEFKDKRYRWIAERTIELLNERTIEMRSEQVEIDTTYKWGIGLHVRTDLPYIAADNVREFIQTFTDDPEAWNRRGEMVSFNADELGVYLPDDSIFPRYKRPLTQIAAINVESV